MFKQYATRVSFAAAVLALAGWLLAAPQIPPDSAGVTVDTGSAPLIHRSTVTYPDAARTKGVGGTVIVEVTLDATGSVADARVVSGPEELRRAVLTSVLGWHFTRDGAGSTRQVRVTFDAAQAKATLAASAAQSAPVPRAALPALQGTLKTLTIDGLSDALRTDLLARLQLHEGDAIGSADAARAAQVVKEFDEHLTISLSKGTGDEFSLRIAVPGALPGVLAARGSETPLNAANQIRVGGNVQQSKLVSQPRPTYPAEAKAGGVQGLVRMQAVINRDGTIKSLEVMEGHPLLVPAALDAVKQWVYQPTLLNGNPVEVITQIDVNFTLSK